MIRDNLNWTVEWRKVEISCLQQLDKHVICYGIKNVSLIPYVLPYFCY